KKVTLRKDWAGKEAEAAPAGGLEILFRPDPTLFDGRFANNGWLQELPKPISRLTWDNAACLSPVTAERLGLGPLSQGTSGGKPGTNGGEHGQAIVDVIELTYRGRTVKAPAWIMPGHADDSITVHLGHGRTRAGRVGTGTGFNAYKLWDSKAPSPWFG